MSLPVVVRNRGNQFAGSLVSAGLLLAMLWTDPYGVVRDLNEQLDWTFELQFSSAMMLISLGAYALFVRPRVELWNDHVVLRNVFKDVRIPYAAVDRLDPESGKYLFVFAAGRRYRALGLEKHNFQIFQDAAGVAGPASDEIAKRGTRAIQGAATAESGRVTTWWRRPEAVEVLLALGWVGYVLVAAVQHG